LKRIVFLLSIIFISFISFANVTFTANNACYTDQTTLAGSSTLPDSMITSWNWDLDGDGDYDDASGQTVIYTYASADTFKVGLKTVLVDGSSDSLSTPIDVVVYPIPNVNFQVDNLCQGKTAVYKDKSTLESGTITQYRWDFNNDGVPEIIGTSPTASFVNGPAGSYTAKLECVTDNGCMSFATKSTEVYTQPEASFTVSDACVGSESVFTNKSIVSSDTNVVYVWDFGDGEQDSENSPKHEYTSGGTFTATLYVIPENNCRDTATVSVIVNSEPTASLEYDGDTIIYQGGTLDISVDGSFNSYSWSNGETTQSISVTKGGVFSVLVTDINNCTKTLSTEIIYKDQADEVTIENDLITPNNDGYNDYFLIDEINSYNTCVFTVYNIWNDVVYSSNDYNNDWSGSDLPAGSYFYILKCDSKPEKIGNINLLK